MTTTATWLGATALLTVLPSLFLHYGPSEDEGCPPYSRGTDQDGGLVSAKKCGECHPDFYKEWDGRAHSKAWTNEVYQAELKKKGEKADVCYNCHIPQSVLKRLGKKPRPRKNKDKDLFHEGITCVSCHEKGGKIHGPFGTKTDAHEVVKDPVFTAKHVYGLCASCHNTNIGPVLAVARDFKASGLAAKGKSCTTCHMPEVERHLAVNALGKPVGKKRKTRKHTVLGPRDPEFLASAFKLSARRNDKDVEVVVQNEAGHKVPALKLRKFVFQVRQLDKDGKELAAGKFVLHVQNRLKVLEKRHFPFEMKTATRKVEVVGEHVFQDKVVARFLKKTLDLGNQNQDQKK